MPVRLCAHGKLSVAVRFVGGAVGLGLQLLNIIIIASHRTAAFSLKCVCVCVSASVVSTESLSGAASSSSLRATKSGAGQIFCAHLIHTVSVCFSILIQK